MYKGYDAILTKHKIFRDSKGVGEEDAVPAQDPPESLPVGILLKRQPHSTNTTSIMHE